MEEANGGSDLGFSDDLQNDLGQAYEIDGIGQFDKRPDFNYSDLSEEYEHSVEFSNEDAYLDDESMEVNGGHMNSFDYNDMSSLESSLYSDGFSDEYSSNGFSYYEDNEYGESMYTSDNSYYEESSDNGSFSEAQFSEDVHAKLAAQEHAEEQAWEDFAEHNKATEQELMIAPTPDEPQPV